MAWMDREGSACARVLLHIFTVILPAPPCAIPGILRRMWASARSDGLKMCSTTPFAHLHLLHGARLNCLTAVFRHC